MDISFGLRKLRKSIASLTILSVLFTLLNVTGIAFAGDVFTDVPNDHYAADAIEDASNAGWISGYGDGNFGPTDQMTRAQLAKVITNAFELDTTGLDSFDPGFPDMPGGDLDLYVKAVASAGVITGYDNGNFGSNDPVQRQDLAVVLHRVLGLSTMTDSPFDFADVDSDDYFYDAVGTMWWYQVVNGYDNGRFGTGDNVIRADAVLMIVRSTGTLELRDVEDDEPSTPSSSDGTLEVELSNDSPESSETGTIPNKATGVTLAVWDFTADGDDIEIDRLVAKQYGIASLPSTHNVFLYDVTDGHSQRLTNGSSVNTTTREVSFNSLDIEVEEGETVSLALRMDMGTTTITSGFEVGFQITSASAIETNADDVDGDFPVQGDIFDVSTTEAGTVTIEKTGSIVDAKVGEDDAVVARFKVSTSTEGADLTELGLYLSGTVSTSDVENFSLFVNGEDDALATVDGVDAQDVARFVLDDPFFIEKGGSKTFFVTADFNTGRTSDTVKLYVDEDTDLLAVGDKYGFGMAVTRKTYDGGSCTTSSGDCSYSTLEGGDITITSSGPAATDIAINGDNISIMDFTVTSVSDATFKNFQISLDASESSDTTEGLLNASAANFTDIRVIDADTEETIWGPIDSDQLVEDDLSTALTEGSGDGDTTGHYIFTDDLEFEAGEERNFSIVLDVENTSTLDGMTLTANLELDSSYPELRDANNKLLTNTSVLVPSADITSKTHTVKSPGLTFSLASTVVSDTFVKGSDDVTFVCFAVEANQASDIELDSLTLTSSFDENAGTFSITGTDNLIATNSVVGSVALQDANGNLIASSQSVQSDGTVVFNNMNYTIDAGQTVPVCVVGDISSNAYANSDDDIIAFGINGTSDVTAIDEDGSTLSTGQLTGLSSAINVSTTSPSVQITISGGGVLTFDVDPSRPNEDIVVAGTTDVEVGKFRISAANEPFIIEQLALVNLDGTNPGDYDNNVTAVTLEYTNEGGSTLTSEGFLTTGNATFTGLDIYVPKDSDTTVTVYADLQTVSKGATAGEFVDLNIALNNFEALAAGSDETYKADKLADTDDDGVWYSEANTESSLQIVDFNDSSFVNSTVYTNDTSDLTGATSLGSSTSFAIDNNGADQTDLPVGTLLCMTDAGADTSCDSSTDDIYVVTAWVDGSTEDTVTATLVNNEGDGTYDAGDEVLFAIPGEQYLTGTYQMHVYETKPTLAVSPNSPSGYSTVSSNDDVIKFTVAADSKERVSVRAGQELTTAAAGVGAICTPAADTDAGDQLDGSSHLCTQAGNTDGDSFTFSTSGSDLSSYARVNFWFKHTTVGGAAPVWADLAIGTAADASAVDQRTALTQTACGADGTTAVTTEWYNCDLAMPTGTASGDDTLHFEYVDATTRLAATDTTHIDEVKVYNEKIVVDAAGGTDIFKAYSANTGNANAPVSATLDFGGTDVTAYLQTNTNGASAGETASAVFIPTASPIEVAKGTTKTFTVEVDTLDFVTLTANDDSVTFSMDLGSSSDGVVTAGDFWWYDTNSTVKWLGDVASNTLEGNTLIY